MNNIHICKNCGKEHDGTYGKGDFCSLHCSRSYAGKKADPKNISNSLKGKGKCRVTYTCEICKQQFLGKKLFLQHKKYCNKRFTKEARWTCSGCNSNFRTRRLLQEHRKTCECVMQHGITYIDYTCEFCKEQFIHTTNTGKALHEKYCKDNPNRVLFKGHSPSLEVREKISSSMKKAIEEGRAVGWKQRKKGSQSYPEKWFESVIKNEFNDKDYIAELQVGKYMLDFAWANKMLYIEIDGAQHKDPKRHESDLKKDAFCKSLGWKVLRLPWSYIMTHKIEAIQIAKDFIDNGNIIDINWVDPKIERTHLSEMRKQDMLNKRNQRINIILSSNIDFTKRGWISKLSKILGISSQKTGKWIKKNMPEFWETTKH